MKMRNKVEHHDSISVRKTVHAHEHVAFKCLGSYL